ncbi:MerR family transcriptional regulator [Nonomuraea sp. NPDC049419]|uniref:MerR family transcriptional regulator n=1 Tax=Nonomuraea sp. NPDC049419 TaxID=3155772 RepID=UPI003412605A
MDELYSIGDAARRTGLSVSAIRFYADAGIVAPTRLAESGTRRYDLRAIARLDLVRTLRDLDTGLDDIRRLLAGETTLHDLFVLHLELVERQERTLRARRAVLRTLVGQGGTIEQAALMQRLVSMSDEERERLIDDFWTEVSEGLDASPIFVDSLRAIRPHLPDDPTATQLEAWIELGDLVGHPDFRQAVRTYLQDAYHTPSGRLMTTTPVQEFIHITGTEIMADLLAAHREGLPPDAPRVKAAATRLAAATADLTGRQPDTTFTTDLAAKFRLIEEIEREPMDEDPAFDSTHGRYLSLVATINATPPDPPLPFTWLAAALLATTDQPSDSR